MTENLRIPKHLAVILDGNRRFAKKLAKDPWIGHSFGADTFRKFLEWIKEFGIEELTAYTLSIQNIKRAKTEVDFLFKLFEDKFSYFLTAEGFKYLEDNDVRVRFLGRTNLLPDNIQNILKELEERTKNFKTKKLNFALAYGGREEIIDAVKKVAIDVSSGKISNEDINEETFKNYLYLGSDPELIIRTSGEKRTSNFLPWQSTYSEWIFFDKLWPEFTRDDLITCLEEFTNRKRRFGK